MNCSQIVAGIQTGSHFLVTDTLGPHSQAFWRLQTDLAGKTRAVLAKQSSSHLPINESLSPHSKLALGDACEGASMG